MNKDVWNRMEYFNNLFEKDLKQVSEYRKKTLQSAIKQSCELVWEGQLSILYDLKKLKGDRDGKA